MNSSAHRFSSWYQDFLKDAGVRNDSVLIIHSAFRQLSRQQIRAEFFCDITLNYLTRGTLLMPTMTWRTVTSEQPVFNVRETPSHTGILSEIFRQRYASTRSLHPTHSVSGCGRDAEGLLSTHHYTGTPCSMESPYGIITNGDLLHNTFFLLVSVGLESCTYIHYFEEVHAPEIYLQEQTETYLLKTATDNQMTYYLRPHRRLPRDFHQFGSKLARNNQLHFVSFEGVSFTLLAASNLSRIVQQSFRKTDYATVAGHSYVN